MVYHVRQANQSTVVHEPRRHRCWREAYEDGVREFLLTMLCALMVVGVTVMGLDACSDASDAAPLQGNEASLHPSQADVDGNGQIDVLDLLLVASQMGQPIAPNPCAIFDRSGVSGHPVFIVIPQEQIDLLASGALRVVRECQ